MTIHGPTSEPELHRPESLADIGKPRPVVADATGEQAAALTGMKANDKLAEAAGVDPAVLAMVDYQEWKRKHGSD